MAWAWEGDGWLCLSCYSKHVCQVLTCARMMLESEDSDPSSTTFTPTTCSLKAPAVILRRCSLPSKNTALSQHWHTRTSTQEPRQILAVFLLDQPEKEEKGTNSGVNNTLMIFKSTEVTMLGSLVEFRIRQTTPPQPPVQRRTSSPNVFELQEFNLPARFQRRNWIFN